MIGALPWPRLGAFAAFLGLLAALAGAVWLFGSARYEAGALAAEVRLGKTLDAERAGRRALVAAHAASQAALTREVERDQIERETRRAAVDAAGRRELDRLRGELSRLGRASGDVGVPTAGACAAGPDGGAVLAQLLGECAAAHVELAGEADAIADRLRGLQQIVAGERGWPTPEIASTAITGDHPGDLPGTGGGLEGGASEVAAPYGHPGPPSQNGSNPIAPTREN